MMDHKEDDVWMATRAVVGANRYLRTFEVILPFIHSPDQNHNQVAELQILSRDGDLL